MFKKVTSAKLFSSISSCAMILNNLGMENVLAIELALHQNLNKNKYVGFILYFVKNYLYRCI